jgi:hypothetical protein
MASNIYGMTGLIGSLAANNYDLYGTTQLPSTWTGSAKTSSSVSNPFSGLSYSDPGDYQKYDSWANWTGADKTYRNQYNDNGYSLGKAKEFYQQPSNGDWASFQNALQQPGEIAAQQAYDKSKAALEEWAGAGGLYGSSIMTKQAKDSVYQPYMDALSTNAANAASTRYQAQDASSQYLANLANNIYGTRTNEWGNLDARNLQEALAQNQFNQTQDQQKAAQQQYLNSYNLSRSNNQNNFNLNKSQGDAQWNQWATNLDNAIMQEAYNNTVAGTKWNTSEQQRIYENNYNLWNNINPTEEEKTQNETASLAAGRDKANSTNWGSLIGSGVGLLAAPMTGGTSLLGSLTSGLGGLFGSSSGFSGGGYGELGNAMFNSTPSAYWK